MLPSSVRQPASARKRALAIKFAAGDIQLNHAFAEYRIRTKLHQILARHQPIHVPFILRQINLAGTGGGNDSVVRIDFLSSQQRLRRSLSITGCGYSSGWCTLMAFSTA